MIKIYIFVLIAYLCGIVPLCKAQDLEVIDKIVVKVDNYAIYKSDLETAVAAILSQQGTRVKNLRCSILKDLILQKVLLVKAEQDSVIVEQAEVESTMDRKFDYYISQFGSEENLEDYYGKTIGQFKQDLYEKEKEQMTIARMKGVISEKISVTPKEVKLFFKQFPKDSLPYFSKEVSVAELVIHPKINIKEHLKARNKLKEIREEIISGASFDKMARKHSDEPSASQTGGDLGMQPRGVMDPKYEAAALSLKINGISKPFKSSFGWHIVQLLKRNGNLYHSRHILIIPDITKKDEIKAKHKIDSVFNLIKLDSLTFSDAAKKVSDAKETSSNGGFYVSSTGEINISAKELDPSVFFAVDTLKGMEYTRIHEIQQRNGRKAYRVLYLDSTVSPHQASLESDYEKLYQAKLNNKKEQVIEKWFKDVIKNVYLDISDDYKHCKLNF